nr:immunoglobulin light chain junction region [Macaca mulatta]
DYHCATWDDNLSGPVF